MPRTRINMIGHRYGQLVVIGEVLPRGKHRKIIAQCDCRRPFSVKVLDAANVRVGRTKSCGCSSNENRSERNRTHGHATGNGSRTYKTWLSMRNRCGNSNDTVFKYYGGRGITVCERWQDFEAFLEDMGERPEGLTIDRIENDGNYEPGNCRWATLAQQRANRRDSKR